MNNLNCSSQPCKVMQLNGLATVKQPSVSKRMECEKLLKVFR
jgi:hypothetical protein